MSTTEAINQSDVTQAPADPQISQQRIISVRPRVDILEETDCFMMLVDLPGVSRADLDVTLEKDQLRLQGIARYSLPEGHHLVSGSQTDRKYERSFRISEEIDRDGIEVELKNGVAYFTLPKSVKAKKVKLPVK